MADALVTHLARALHLPPDAAQQTLHHLVSTLREQIEATGEAAVPGLGVFRRSGTHLAFEPEDALVRAVNHRYAGLAPVGAAPAPPRASPSDETTAAPAGFQPLPSFINQEEPDAPTDTDHSSEPELASAPDVPIEPGLPDPPEQPDEPALVETPPPDDVVVPETPSDPVPEEALVPESEPTAEPDESPDFDKDDDLDIEEAPLEAEDHAPDMEEEPLKPDEDLLEEVATFDALSDLESENDESGDAEFEDEEDSLDGLLAGTWTEGADVSESEPHPLGPMPEEPVEEADYSLVETEDEDAEAALIVATESASSAEPLEPEHTEDPEPVAPAVAAMAAAASGSTEPADARPSRGPLIAGLVVGTLLALAFLLWVRNRDSAPPPIAERPSVTDTVAATSPPVDTSATALPADPVAELPSADPLRSSGEVDPTEGGFTWVIGSELNRAAAERRVGRYREQGFRAGVVSQEAAGRTRYRVSLGQFATIAEAEARRDDLPTDVPSDSWILRL